MKYVILCAALSLSKSFFMKMCSELHILMKNDLDKERAAQRNRYFIFLTYCFISDSVVVFISLQQLGSYGDDISSLIQMTGESWDQTEGPRFTR